MLPFRGRFFSRRLSFFVVLFVQACALVSPAASPDEEMAEEFVVVALGREMGGSESPAVQKWVQSVRVGLFGGTELQRKAARGQIAELAHITGHPMALVRENGTAGGNVNFSVHLPAREEIPALLKSTYPDSPRIRRRLVRTNCFFGYRTSAGDEILSAHVVVPDDLSAAKFRHCLAEEMSQAMGLPNDDSGISGSIFNDRNTGDVLSAKDRLFLKLLYRPEIRPGMKRAATVTAVRALLESRQVTP